MEKPSKEKGKADKVRAVRGVFLAHNSGDIEGIADIIEEIREMGIRAGRNASAEAKAAGITRVYVHNLSELIRISPAGESNVISPINKRRSFYVSYKPLTVFKPIFR